MVRDHTLYCDYMWLWLCDRPYAQVWVILHVLGWVERHVLVFQEEGDGEGAKNVAPSSTTRKPRGVGVWVLMAPMVTTRRPFKLSTLGLLFLDRSPVLLTV